MSPCVFITIHEYRLREPQSEGKPRGLTIQLKRGNGCRYCGLHAEEASSRVNAGGSKAQGQDKICWHLELSTKGQDIQRALNINLANRFIEIQLSGHVANSEADVLVLPDAEIDTCP
jgi:hypothetical protein